MSNYYGDFRPGQTVRIRFNTVNTSGAPTTLTSGAVAVSKDGSDVTPTGGVALTTDAGGVTGRHHVVIDLGVDPTTFSAGSDYAVRLSAGTVGGTSVVGVVLGEWSIANRAVQVNSAGNALVDIQTIKTQAVTASTGVTFPATIGTSTYAGADTSGTTTLLSRLTSGRASNLDNLDAAVSTVNTAVAAISTTIGVAGAGLTGIPKTGFRLASDGLDSIAVETGVNARQALSPILAAAAGVIGGAGTTTVTIKGGNVATTRITATVDSSGNRSAVTLAIPT